jgi:hypothetical protein
MKYKYTAAAQGRPGEGRDEKKIPPPGTEKTRPPHPGTESKTHSQEKHSLCIGSTSGLDLVVFSRVGWGVFSPLFLCVVWFVVGRSCVLVVLFAVN